MNTDNNFAPDNTAMQTAWDLINHTNANVFLTGKAGTGKTTFLKRLRQRSDKRIVTLAPTGIAAINAGGVTIHSFLQLPMSVYIPGMNTVASNSQTRRHDLFTRDKLKLIKSVDLIVIDEVSMVRSDLLDAVDAVLRRHRNPCRPFGGVQMLLVGDLYQLPPVVTEAEAPLLGQVYESPYFFDSLALKSASFVTLQLDKIYRQTDNTFLNILNAVRCNKIDADILRRLNTRYLPSFDDDNGFIRLVTHNQQADRINKSRMEALPARQHVFDAVVKGNFNESAYPADAKMTLKAGAQVMFIRNDPEHRYFNGLIGTVQSIDDNEVLVRASDSGDLIAVTPVQWENIRYTLNEETSTIEQHIDGTFRQLPLRPAWAITVHKSQGLTFDHAIIDVSHSFAHGQVYVALSRCRTLDGIILSAPVTASSVMCDQRIVSFEASRNAMPDARQALPALKRSFMSDIIAETFSMDSHISNFSALDRCVADFLGRKRPDLLPRYSDVVVLLNTLKPVADKFISLCRNHIAQVDPYGDIYLAERLESAAAYFAPRLAEAARLLADTPAKCDNAAGTRRLVNIAGRTRDALFTTRHILANIALEPFTPERYLRLKAQAIILNDPSAKRKTKSRPTAKTAPPSAELQNPALYAALTEWRTAEANRQGVASFVIASNRALVAVAESAPRTYDELLECDGWGTKKASRYADDILAIVRESTN